MIILRHVMWSWRAGQRSKVKGQRSKVQVKGEAIISCTGKRHVIHRLPTASTHTCMRVWWHDGAHAGRQW